MRKLLPESWELQSVVAQQRETRLKEIAARLRGEKVPATAKMLVSSYLLDDRDPKWLEELGKRERNFHYWLERACDTAHTPAEQHVLRALENVYGD